MNIWCCRLIAFGRLFLCLLVAPIVYGFPRNRKKVVFGAWSGRIFQDNPKYFLGYALEHTDWQCVWIAQEHLRAQVVAFGKGRVKFARRRSLSSWWHMLTASYLVCNVNWQSDILDFPMPTYKRIINLWHGIPFKQVGGKQLQNRAPEEAPAHPSCWLRHTLHQLLVWGNRSFFDHTSWTSVSSETMGQQLADSFPWRFALERMCYAGLPRNDFLIQHQKDVALQCALRKKYAALLGASPSKRWILYVPTFRYAQGGLFSFSAPNENTRISKILARLGAEMIEKQHPRVLLEGGIRAGRYGAVTVLSEREGQQVDLQELMLVSDIMITDYSSCFFDFSLLNRPVIHFAYDYEDYASKDTGVYYDLSDVCAGPICRSVNEVYAALEKPQAELLAARGKSLAELTKYEQGRASATLIQVVQEHLR